MEKWKLGIIGLLLVALVGYGVWQPNPRGNAATSNATGSASMGAAAGKSPEPNKAAVFIGQTWGGQNLPEWPNLGPWENTKQAVTVASLKGKPSLVEFFRINCSHCQEAAPFMEMLYQRYRPRGLNMVAVQSPGLYKDPQNEETQWPSVQNWIKAAGLTYPVAMDANSAYFQQTIKGTFYPTVMIANADGKIIEAHTGHDIEKAISLAVELEKLLPGAGTPKARAQNLAKFLRPLIYSSNGGAPVNSAIEKSFADDLEQRLKGKV